jgi:hypothetical protein
MIKLMVSQVVYGRVHSQEDQAHNDGLEGGRHDSPGANSLSSNHRQEVGTSNSESGVENSGPESSQPTNVGLSIEVGNRSGVTPETETETVLDGVATEHNDEGEDEETEHEQNLAQDNPEFGFGKVLCRPEVEHGVGCKTGDWDDDRIQVLNAQR